MADEMETDVCMDVCKSRCLQAKQRVESKVFVSTC